MGIDAIAKRLTTVRLSDNRERCRLEYQEADDSTGSLDFPSDQLDEIVELLLHAEARKNEVSLSSKRPIAVLIPDNVEVSLERKTQRVILNFHVGQRRMAFGLPREQAVNLVAIVSEKLPYH